ncbi:uncharacterized protein RHOBADRAFT_47064 [Rhodotorula graminis WP1]|uniref:F-box domain-containing protein n=1 Tax=Rhodotorula graminis (strain WP1) TaxID=578459 RepID=A0A0N8PZG0_RHOGW|nr:uncharacterized protein RHOBADRAFT_47064 [Rhodotorula graminis WP1]KPV72221.1 hypothetical protein RHOBADRAFT_47064 [Rhodotorula graminis WP1]
MSDRLNDDVLKLVFDELAPIAFAGSTYRQIKRVLLCLCRTSRRYCAIAQPLLWRHVRVWSPKQLEQLRASSTASGLGRCTVAYDVESQYSHSLSDALDVSDLLPNIVALRVLAARGSVDAALLVKHQALENVELRGVHLDGPSAPPSRTLKHILIADSMVSTPFLRRWFTPSLLPTLRTVHVERATDLSTSLPVQLDDILARPLLDQLDCVYTSSEHVDPQSVLGGSVEPPVLFVRHDPSAPFPRHSNPRILPTCGVVEALIRADATGQVRLIWSSERQPGSKGPLTLQFHEFWQYARELKAARAGSTGR